jgi:hypothetical protein
MWTSPLLLSIAHTYIRIINQMKQVFLEMLIVTQFVTRNLRNIMEPKSSFPRSQKPNPDPCPGHFILSYAISLRSNLIVSSQYLPMSSSQNFVCSYLLLCTLSISPSQYSLQHPTLKHPQVFSLTLSGHSRKGPAPTIFLVWLMKNFNLRIIWYQKGQVIAQWVLWKCG